MAVTTGMMTPIKVDTDTARLILYTCFASRFAGGVGFQAPQVAVQTTLPTADATMGLAVILFAQSFGLAVFIIIEQTMFTIPLGAKLGLDLATIESIGVGDLKNSFGKNNVDKVVLGVDRSLSQT